jgi:hypothetical protein
MKRYFNNWNLIRILRIGLGIFIIVQGVRSADQVLILLGGIFSLMPLLNIGCCTTAIGKGSSKESTDIQDISYEEVR